MEGDDARDGVGEALSGEGLRGGRIGRGERDGGGDGLLRAKTAEEEEEEEEAVVEAVEVRGALTC